MVEAFFVIAAECDKDPLFVYKLSGKDVAAVANPGSATVRPAKRALDAGTAGSSASHAQDVKDDDQSDDSDCVYLCTQISVY